MLFQAVVWLGLARCNQEAVSTQLGQLAEQFGASAVNPPATKVMCELLWQKSYILRWHKSRVSSG